MREIHPPLRLIMNTMVLSSVVFVQGTTAVVTITLEEMTSTIYYDTYLARRHPVSSSTVLTL
jgi:hypothetical protein